MIILHEFIAVSVRPWSCQPIEMVFYPLVPRFEYDLVVAYQCLHFITLIRR